MPSAGDLLAGRYRIDARLGAGGMATVWRARDLRLDRDVAVKVLLPNLAADASLVARFDREARALAALSDPHVVGIHDVVEGGAGGEPFIVMELCPDGSLGDRLAGGAALASADALPILADAAAGLAAIHAHGLVHRDVTPRNILLAGGTARLGDLGLARVGDVGTTAPGGGLTPTGTAVGTLGYLAPELLDGRPASRASDVYGLAAVAYRTLTGSLPRPAGSIAELVAARERQVTPPARLVPGISTAAASAIDRGLDPDPARRPDAAAMLAAFAPGGAAPRAPDAWRPDVGAPRPAPAPAPGPPPTADAARRGHGARRPLPEPSTGYHGPGLWSGEVLAIIAVAVVIIAIVLVFGGRPG